jgi:hypothetical protein
MNSRVIMCTWIAILLLWGSSYAQAPTSADLNVLRSQIDQLKADYEKRIQALEAQLQALQGQTQNAPQPEPTVTAAPQEQQPTAPVPSGAQGAGGPTGALPVYGGASGSKIFNPDIAVIGDFIGASGENKVNPLPAMQMHETETSFQAVVDPYARADFFLSFGQEGVDLEEGYITFPTFPGGLLLRVGKMRAAFGKVNTFHNHQLSWIDRPIMTDNLVGGEEGDNDAGFSVARLIPNPWIFLEATGQVFRGDSDDLFHSSQRGDLNYVGHLRGYHDITQDANIDIGASYSRGHNPSGIVPGLGDIGRFRTTLLGTDATIRWKPLKRSIYRSFLGRSEFVWSRRGQPGGVQSALGYYFSGDYQFARRWVAGLRYDYSKQADNALLVDKGQSALLTFVPSEFSLVRGQYRRTQYAVGPTADEFLFQFQFSIGAHGAHPF